MKITNDKLLELRKEKGYSRDYLALLTKTSATWIRRLEIGESVSNHPSRNKALAKALGWLPEDMFEPHELTASQKRCRSCTKGIRDAQRICAECYKNEQKIKALNRFHNKPSKKQLIPVVERVEQKAETCLKVPPAGHTLKLEFIDGEMIQTFVPMKARYLTKKPIGIQ